MTTMEELMELKAKLAVNSDELNKRLLMFEEELAKLSIGLIFWFKLDDHVRIGYMSFKNGGWQLASEYTSSEGEKNCSPLLKTNRGVRYAAYIHRDEILAELLKTAKKFNEKLEKALNGEGNSNDNQ